MKHVILTLSLILSGYVHADGSDKYTPTKVEYLVLLLNAEAKGTYGGVAMGFSIKGDNTVLINLTYPDDQPESAIEEAARIGKSMIDVVSRAKRWNWVKTEINKNPVSTKK